MLTFQMKVKSLFEIEIKQESSISLLVLSKYKNST